jgi:hypothetical protein
MSMKIRIRFAWWLKPYLACLCFFCALHGAAPEPEKLNRVIRRAVRLDVV